MFVSGIIYPSISLSISPSPDFPLHCTTQSQHAVAAPLFHISHAKSMIANHDPQPH
ncbi:hypothetical protein Hanom_Chr17g01545131 [Helianthus anomalus]